MFYTTENYEQDKRIAMHVFNRNFKGHYLKDDLIQVAVIELWKLRQKKNYKDYVKCACTVARNHMINYLKKESRHYSVSLYEKLGNENDLQLIDVLLINEPAALDYCECRDIVKSLAPITMQMSGRDRGIISLYLKHYSQTEIANRSGVSQQYVSKVIKKFREAARFVLDD